MPLIKLRELGKYGVNADIDPYDLPPQAFSRAVNARFVDGRAQRGPVMRTVSALAGSSPRFLAANTPVLGTNDLYVAYKNGTVYKWTASGETAASISAYTPNVVDTSSFCATHLARVLYLNRDDRVPWSITPSGSTFSALANWNANWRCKVLRAYNSALVALNVTKTGTSFPTMVKTSSFAVDAAVPTSWDETDPATNAYENILSQMDGEIKDAQTMREALIIYSSKQTWGMQATGDSQIYSVRPLFTTKGAINTNCVIEVNGVHYVFGQDDIWMHDGVSPRSICDRRVRKYIFASMNQLKTYRCFAAHNPLLKEISFCYVSADDLVSFTDFEGCNRSAVYNYVDDTWSFDDLPFVFASEIASVGNTAATWTTVSGTWGTVGGAWLDYEDGAKQGLVYAGGAGSPLVDSLYAHDRYGTGSLFAFPVNASATKPLQLQRDGIDLDELDTDLTGYKVISSIYPQLRLSPDAAAAEFQWGSSDSFGAAASQFSDWQTYDGAVLNKLDFRNAGRYLAMNVRHVDYRNFSLSGLDFDLEVLGER